LGNCNTLNRDAIKFFDGKAQLTGGYIRCDVNVRDTLSTLNPPIEISEVENYRYYTIIAIAALSETSKYSDYSNPVGYYMPSNSTYPGNGLFLPWSPNGLNMTSIFNDVVNVSLTDLELNNFYTFTAEHDDGLVVPIDSSTVFTATHEISDKVVGVFSPRDRVNVWTDGGVFWVGASPRDSEKTFIGTFEEVIFDPTDIGRPPSTNVVRPDGNQND
jgi:hypothetical protein